MMFAHLSVAAEPQKQPLQYQFQLAARRTMLEVMGSRSLGLTEKVPMGIQLPQFQSDKPLFARWTSPMVKNGHLPIALDRTQDRGPYDRLFIDLNEDGRLKEETTIVAYWISQTSALFGPVELTFSGLEGPIAYHLNFEFFSYEDTRNLIVYPDAQYEGTIQVGSAEKSCVLIDYNANGAFNDVSLDPRQSDRIQIGQPNVPDSLKTGFMGNFIEVDGQLYELEVAQNGSYIKLAPAQGVIFGKVRLPEDIAEFAAAGENGLFTRKSPKGLVELPVGKYRIDHWTMVRQDEKYDQWMLRGSEFGLRGDFEVLGDTITTLSLGEPISCGLDIINTGPGTYILNQILKGQLSESIRLTRNGALTGDLKINITRTDGSYVKTEYLEDA